MIVGKNRVFPPPVVQYLSFLVELLFLAGSHVLHTVLAPRNKFRETFSEC